MLCKSITTPLLALAGAWVANSSPLESSVRSTPVSKRWLPDGKIRGVNLGSQFIIEKWMANDEWSKNMGCGDTSDEWSCVQKLGQEGADSVFKKHWDSWITQDDIKQIKSLGLNTIRIPVGFWIKEDLVHSDEYYPKGGLYYLDRIVGWASDVGLYTIIDLHAAPGSQAKNEEFTGHGVDTPGFYTKDNYERAYEFLEWMTERIHQNHAYRNAGMLEIVNEPIDGSQGADMVKNYYPEAWNRIRAREAKLGVSKDKLIHIQMMDKTWGSGDPVSSLPNNRTNAFFDDHRYYKFDTRVEATKDGYISAACKDNRGGADTVVGEWSLSVASKVEHNDEFEINNRPDQIDWYRKWWAAQVQTFEKAGGWIFWSWKCNYIGGYDDWRWCYQSAVKAQVIPQDAGSASAINAC
ncbi:glycoside hydrolase family 5 protein [Whalleya microplaca]|nr:glycoside hydrolase family 5 protein [Whalleya microplaca]